MTKADAESERAVAMLKADRDELVARLTGPARKKGRGDCPAGEAADRENAGLRQEIGDLAARMVVMAMAGEGENSPIEKILAGPETLVTASGKATLSLAGRVRALRKSGS